MASPDPVKLILENVSDELHPQFVDELSTAVKDVCAVAHDPNQVGQRAARLAQVIRSWHLTVALHSNEAWRDAVAAADHEVPSRDKFGTVEDFRELVTF